MEFYEESGQERFSYFGRHLKPGMSQMKLKNANLNTMTNYITTAAQSVFIGVDT